MQFTHEDIAPMAVGAAVLGAGGGGDSYLTEGMLTETIRANGPIEILAVDEFSLDAAVLPLALVGAPHVVNEMLLGELMLDTALAYSTEGQGAPAAVVTIEMAGLNALIPLIAASRFGLPIVDADFTGRGVPSLEMTSFRLDEHYPEHQVLADPLGRGVRLTGSKDFSVEMLLRPLVTVMGSLTAYTMYPVHGRDLRTRSLGGTLTRCLEVGRVFQGLPGHTATEVDEMLSGIDGVRVATGTVAERLSQPELSSAQVSITLEDDDYPDRLTRIDLKDEFHLVTRDGELLATVPDLIVVVDSDTWIPLTVEQVGLGQRVTVIALPAHTRWRSERGVRLTGPRAFGYSTDYVPFDQREVRA